MPPGCLIKYKSIQTVQILYSCLFYDSEFTSVITASTAYSMINMPFATVRTYSQSRCYCLIMSSSLCSSCFRLSSLRMCHFLLNFNYYLIFFLIHSSGDRSVPRLLLQRYHRHHLQIRMHHHFLHPHCF